MLLRGLLEASGETVQDLVLAADERFWDAYELALQGRPYAAIYLAGFVAEMLLKTAGFFFDQARPGDLVQPRLAPAKAFGQHRFPGIHPESYHSLRFWCAFLEHKRNDAGKPFGAAFLAEIRGRVDRTHDVWWIFMRYRNSAVPAQLASMAETAVLPVLEPVDSFS